jgi:hypothetical protein
MAFCLGDWIIAAVIVVPLLALLWWLSRGPDGPHSGLL